MADFATQVRLLFPWIPEGLVQTFTDAWSNYGGDVNLAMGELRQSPAYETYFPGNKRPDGSTMYAEADYLSIKEGYDRQLRAVGQDPAMYQDRYPDMLASGKSPSELAADLASVQEQVVNMAPEVRARYAAAGYSSDLSTAAIFASVLNPGVTPQEHQRQFALAQIGGATDQRGLSIGDGQVEKLYQAGLTGQKAADVFGQVAAEFPTYQQLVARNDNPDDPFTLDDYTNALVLKDPNDLALLDRVMRREQVGYSNQDLFQRDQQGGATGIRQR